MNEYYFDLAGLQAVLCTQEALCVTDRLQPFLSKNPTRTDCVIRVHTTETLPEISPQGVWNGMECYDRCGDTLRIFHSEAHKKAPFAMARLEADGNIAVFVLPGYMDRFSGTAGVLNRIGLENLLLQHSGLLLHAAFIEYEGKGILFTGPSGIGKSTQAELWRRHLKADVINGDRAVLRKCDGGWKAYGSPYAGSSGIYRKESAPVTAIVSLEQGTENKLQKLSVREAFSLVYPQLALCRWDKVFMEKATDLALTLLGDVPVYRLVCRPEKKAAVCLKKGLGL